jgi:putative protease
MINAMKNKDINIVVPLRDENFVQEFCDAGAGSFYCGYISFEWLNKYGIALEYNRRGNFHLQANFSDSNKLAIAINIAHANGKEVFLTLNAIRISVLQIEYIRIILENFSKIGGDGVIISDISIISLAKEYGLKVSVSSCANVINVAYANYLSNVGVNHIIFPRDILIDDIREIVKTNPLIGYEAFIMNSACKFVDGNCLGLHNHTCGSLCNFIDNSKKKFFCINGSELTKSEKIKLANNSYYYCKLFVEGCGLCALYDLVSLVTSLKIVGRLLSPEKVIQQIRLLRANISIALSVNNKEEYISKILFEEEKRQKFCICGLNCYYKD